MAILNSLIVNGVSRFLGKIYCDNLEVSDNITTAGAVYTGISGLYVNGKQAVFTNSASDNWLRINGGTFSSGVYFGSSNVRTDGELQVGSGGAYLKSNSTGTTIKNLIVNEQAHIGSSLQVGSDGAYLNVTSTSVSIPNLITQSARTTNMIVDDTIRAKTWDLQIVQTTGAQMISPMIYFAASASVITTTVSGTTVNLVITDTNITSAEYGGATWYKGSKVKLSGKIGNTVLGSADATVVANMNSTANKLQLAMTWNDATTDFKANTTYTQSDLKAMLYQINVTPNASTADLHPVGIYLSAYDENKKSSISIYGGSASSTFTTPDVRIGLLTGMSAIGGITPTGWGIATTNGYFKGTIASQSGQIGGWSIGSATLTNGTLGADNSIWLLTEDRANADAKAIGGSSELTTWRITSGSKFGVTKDGTLYASNLIVSGGTIGGWTIGESSMYTNNHTAWNTNDDGLFLSADGIAGGKQGIWYLWNDGSAKIGAMTLSASGVLSVPAANITGTLSADRIAANSISSSKLILSDPTNYITVNESNSASAITENHPFGNPSVVSEGYITKKNATDNHIALCGYTQNSFNEGDELYYSISIKGAADGTASVRIYFYGDGSTDQKTYILNRNGGTISFTTSDAIYTGTIKINAAAAACGFYAISLSDTTSTKNQIYIKKASMRKKSGGNLIVDGAITAAKLSVLNLSAISSNLGTITGGSLTIGDDAFSVTSEGVLTATGATISGIITATSGTIGGITAHNNYGLYTNGKTSATSTKTGFLISKNGAIYLGAYDSSVGACPFQVTSDGALTATSATVTGAITATSGTIGAANTINKITIGTNATNASIYYGMSSLSDTSNNGFYIGTDGIALGKGAFKVTNTGVLNATGATISGTLTAGANSKIGPWTVTATSIYKTNATMGNATAGAAYFGDNGLSITDKFKVTSAGALTSTSGTIGGIEINTNSISTPKSSSTAVNNSGYMYLGSVGTSATINGTTSDYFRFVIGNQFGVVADGTLYASNAKIAGKITATEGSIGGFTIDTDNIRTGTLAGTTDGYIALSSAGFTRKLNGISRDYLRFAIGSSFGVSTSGTVYAGDLYAYRSIKIHGEPISSDNSSTGVDYECIRATGGLFSSSGTHRTLGIGTDFLTPPNENFDWMWNTPHCGIKIEQNTGKAWSEDLAKIQMAAKYINLSGVLQSNGSYNKTEVSIDGNLTISDDLFASGHRVIYTKQLSKDVSYTLSSGVLYLLILYHPTTEATRGVYIFKGGNTVITTLKASAHATITLTSTTLKFTASNNPEGYLVQLT